MKNSYDFSGWATKANLLCSDGRVIMPDAFKDCDGEVVPLVWSHNYSSVDNVLGHALLESRDGSIYTYCSFNDTEHGKDAKKQVEHGDITQLSIFANQLKQNGRNVVHGVIKEVSLVLAGANPGASIDSVISHNEFGEFVEPYEDLEQGIFYTDTDFELYHSDINENDSEDKLDHLNVNNSNESTLNDTLEHSDTDEDVDEEETIGDIYNTLTDKQKGAVATLIDAAFTEGVNKNKIESKDNKSEDKSHNNEEANTMKHNVFEESNHEENNNNTLTHADGVEIVKMAKSYGGGSLKAAMEMYVNDNKTMAHADLGFDNIESLFPEYKLTKPGAPTLNYTDANNDIVSLSWAEKILSRVHKSPISRIKTREAFMPVLRNEAARRAKGYPKKAEMKKDLGNLKLMGRTTDPTTIYAKSKLDHDDTIDIVDFDIVNYMYNADKISLRTELAYALLVGDQRDDMDADKIDETHIRPIWTDDELYTIHADVDLTDAKAKLQGTDTGKYFGDEFVYATAIRNALLYARERYAGSGSPDFFCTPHLVNMMLMAMDRNGQRMYRDVNDIKASLNVHDIITMESIAGLQRTTNDEGPKTKELLGLMVNLNDYSLGCVKGGELTHFTQFDIDFNQHKSLLETRLSGALTRIKSAVALEIDKTV